MYLGGRASRHKYGGVFVEQHLKRGLWRHIPLAGITAQESQNNGPLEVSTRRELPLGQRSRRINRDRNAGEKLPTVSAGEAVPHPSTRAGRAEPSPCLSHPGSPDQPWQSARQQGRKAKSTWRHGQRGQQGEGCPSPLVCAVPACMAKSRAPERKARFVYQCSLISLSVYGRLNLTAC